MSNPSEDPNATQTEFKSLHVKHGDDHLVGIRNLKVILIEEDGYWFAQGLDVDYAAEEKTQEGVKSSFEDGFYCTIHEHLRVYGNLEKFLVPAPGEVWKELFYDQCGDVNEYSQISLHNFTEKAAIRLPFTGITYIHREKAAA